MSYNRRWMGPILLLLTVIAVMFPISALQAQSGNGCYNDLCLGKGTISNPILNEGSWSGSYIYYGKYDGKPTKYRVLANSTNRYGGTTMLLDCDSVLYKSAFDNDRNANSRALKSNEWAYSDVKAGLNGSSFLDKEGVFTSAEKSAIAKSIVSSHELGDTVSSWTKNTFGNYIALTGEKVFLLDAEEVSTNSYGYSITDESAFNRQKIGAADRWWLRSSNKNIDDWAGIVPSAGYIDSNYVDNPDIGVSPAFNVNLSSVIFSSVIPSSDNQYKLTLLDENLSISLSNNENFTRKVDLITIPYTIKGSSAADGTKAYMMVTDKAYTIQTVMLQFCNIAN